MASSDKKKSSCDKRTLTRREMIGVSSTVLIGGSVAAGMHQWMQHENGQRAEVCIQQVEHYSKDIVRAIRDGLTELGISRNVIRGKRIVLKPNLVETAIDRPHINTHPSVIVAAAEVFRRWDAAEVIVAEGQGHRRDSVIVLDESGMGQALREAQLPFVDLNHDDVAAVDNLSRWTKLPTLYLPKTILNADWVVSVPKLKTHHWMGVTCAMKNLFGVMPGIIYGWPKNVLHYHGIAESILDIHTAVKPNLAIIDGIVGMEGDGPIMGTAKHVGCLIMGKNAAAVDATATRVMGLNPYGVAYLKGASGSVGPIHEKNIAQRGENIARVQSRFDVLDYPHLHAVAAV